MITIEQTKEFSTLKVILTCIGLFASQSAMNVVFAFADPIMEHMHFNENQCFLCWASIAIAGLITQPLVGVYSDRCKSRLGRRKPFIITGITGTTIALIAITVIRYKFSIIPHSLMLPSLMLILFLTFVSIHLMFGPMRSLIADVVPYSQQGFASVISAYMLAAGDIIPNLIGALDFFTNGKLGEKADMITISVVTILNLISVCLTLVFVKDMPLPSDLHVDKENPFYLLYHGLKVMPFQIKMACLLNMFGWMADYPFCIKTTLFFQKEIFPDNLEAMGLSFGMLTLALSNCVIFFFGLISHKVLKFFGLRLTVGLSHMVMMISLLFVLFSTNYWSLCFYMLFIGCAVEVFYAIPFEIIGISSNANMNGIFVGIMNCASVVGQFSANIFTSFVIGLPFDKFYNRETWPTTRYAAMIGCPSIFALVVVCISPWLSFTGDPNESEEDHH